MKFLSSECSLFFSSSSPWHSRNFYFGGVPILRKILDPSYCDFLLITWYTHTHWHTCRHGIFVRVFYPLANWQSEYLTWFMHIMASPYITWQTDMSVCLRLSDKNWQKKSFQRTNICIITNHGNDDHHMMHSFWHH